MDQNKKQIEFLKLYEPSRESLVRFSKAMTRNREDALDLVQETTLKAFDSFEKLQEPKAFKSYLFTIASRIHKRQIWRKRLFVSNNSSDSYDEDMFENLVEPNNNPDELHDIKVLHETLKKLPDEQREAIILFEILGFSMSEISEIQKTSVSGVKSRVQRGRKTLKKLLKPDTETYGDAPPIAPKRQRINTVSIFHRTRNQIKKPNILAAEVHNEIKY